MPRDHPIQLPRRVPIRPRPLARHAPNNCSGRRVATGFLVNRSQRLGLLLEGNNLVAAATAAAGSSIAVCKPCNMHNRSACARGTTKAAYCRFLGKFGTCTLGFEVETQAYAGVRIPHDLRRCTSIPDTNRSKIFNRMPKGIGSTSRFTHLHITRVRSFDKRNYLFAGISWIIRCISLTFSSFVGLAGPANN
eukprot:1195082-Prorocentrum_minimum.AAC.11